MEKHFKWTTLTSLPGLLHCISGSFTPCLSTWICFESFPSLGFRAISLITEWTLNSLLDNLMCWLPFKSLTYGSIYALSSRYCLFYWTGLRWPACTPLITLLSHKGCWLPQSCKKLIGTLFVIIKVLSFCNHSATQQSTYRILQINGAKWRWGSNCGKSRFCSCEAAETSPPTAQLKKSFSWRGCIC